MEEDGRSKLQSGLNISPLALSGIQKVEYRMNDLIRADKISGHGDHQASTDRERQTEEGWE